MNINVAFTVKGGEVFGEGEKPKWVTTAKRRWIGIATGNLYVAARRQLAGEAVNVRSGRLLRALVAEFGLVGDEPAGRVGTVRGPKGSHGFLGRMFETGIKPHPIKGRRGRTMILKKGNEWIRKRQVDHPGVSDRRWLWTAIQDTMPANQSELTRQLETELHRTAEQSQRKVVSPDAGTTL